MAPNQQYKMLIDYILVQKHNCTIKNFTINGMEKFKFYTDHRLLTVSLRIDNLRINRKFKPIVTKNINSERYKSELNKRLQNLITTQPNELTPCPTTINNKIQKSILLAVQKSLEENDLNTVSQKTENDNELQKLHKKRAELPKIKNKSNNDKIELNLVSKVIRQKIRERDEKEVNKIITETIEGNKNIKTMKKRLGLGTYWTTHLVNGEGAKVYDRNSINKLATKFYEELYEDNEKQDNTKSNTDPTGAQAETEQEPEPNLELEPEFILDEVEHAIKGLKSKKSPDHDKIINKYLKMGGISFFIFLTLLSLFHFFSTFCFPTYGRVLQIASQMLISHNQI